MDATIDLDRYPLDRPGSDRYRALVVECQAALAAEGMFNLDGFLRPGVADRIVKTITPRFATDAFTHARRHNIYFRRSVDGLPDDHPALRTFETVNHTLCGDTLADTDISTLYHWPPFARFLADTMMMADLYPMDDPLAGANVMRYEAGEALNWHFDRSEFTTTLLLQAPAAGGAFEYVTDLRSDDDPSYDAVARLIDGDHPLRQLSLEAGTLNIFRGKNTAHRVTPVEGDTARVIAVFSYYDRPGVRFTAEEQIGFYGRASR